MGIRKVFRNPLLGNYITQHLGNDLESTKMVPQLAQMSRLGSLAVSGPDLPSVQVSAYSALQVVGSHEPFLFRNGRIRKPTVWSRHNMLANPRVFRLASDQHES